MENDRSEYSRSSRVASGKWGIMYKTFKVLFPTLSEKIIRWGRFDQASIFLVDGNSREYIFVYRNDRDWSIQTRTNYLNELGKREKK